MKRWRWVAVAVLAVAAVYLWSSRDGQLTVRSRILTRELVPDLAQVIREQAGSGLRFRVMVVPDGGHIPASSLSDGLRFYFSSPP